MINVALLIILNHGFIASDKLLYVFIIGNLSPGYLPNNNKNFYVPEVIRMILDTVVEKKKGTHTRYLILLIIFIVTAVNYADRATLSIAGTEVAKELQLSAISMGYIFSAFGWAYLLMQILAAGCWISSARRKFTLTVCSSGRCSPFCRVLSICSR